MKISIIALALVVLFSFVSMTTQQPLASAPSLQTKVFFLSQLEQLQKQLGVLQKKAQQKELAASQQAYASARAAFKRIELLIAYLDPQLYERQLNESPLLKPAPKVPNKEIHYPGGFQCLDEQLYGETVDFAKVVQFTQDMLLNLQVFSQRMQNVQLYDALLIHAMKEQLLRSFTLGITGFDTPASSFALADLQEMRQGMATILDYYKGRFSADLVNAAQAILSTPNTTSFEDFDRYGYLVSQLLPLLELLEKIRTTAHLETKEELVRQPLPYQSTFTNPFQKDFLNASYYTKIPTQEYTKARIALGERLFNDPILSKHLKTSCSTCHNKKTAFTDQLPLSKNGDQSQTSTRNAPSLNYSVYASSYFYDLRAHDLKNQFDHVIHSEKEFGSSYPEIVKKLQQTDYQEDFAALYANYPQPISSATINHALKCYLMSLASFDAPFDKWVSQKTTAIPKEVRQGFNLFMGKAQCGTCHFPPTFGGLVPPSYKESESEVLGVLQDENFKSPVLDKDLGRKNNGVVKENFEFFAHSFKTVSIRNAQKTAPYMHNGSISNLDKVLEFYDLGGGAGMGLPLEHQTLPSEALNLTEVEKKALISFINALTDASYL